MFVRVKKIGAYEYLYLVGTRARADAMSSALSRRSAGATKSKLPD